MTIHLSGNPEHGTRARYTNGCRCGECRGANARRWRERRARAAELAAEVKPSGPPIPSSLRRAGKDVGILRCPGANGSPCVSTPATWLKGQDVCLRCIERATVWDGLVPADRVRAHVAELRRRGVGKHQIADAAGVAHTRLMEIAAGAPSVRASTERRILAVDVGAIADGARVDARAAHRILRRLVARGFTKSHLAELLGRTSPVGGLQLGRRMITARKAADIERLERRVLAGEIAPRRAFVEPKAAAPARRWIAEVLERGADRTWLERRLGFAIARPRLRASELARVTQLRADVDDVARVSRRLPDDWRATPATSTALLAQAWELPLPRATRRTSRTPDVEHDASLVDEVLRDASPEASARVA